MTTTSNIQVAKKQTIATASNDDKKLEKVHFSTLIKSESVQKALVGTLGDAMHAKTFTSSLISAVSTNPQLSECNGMTIISAALLGESLKLSPSPQLGQYYLVPFRDNKAGIVKATFQIGWKGYYQLAMRSGQYKKLNVVAIKEGELKSYNPITEDIDLDPIMNPLEREHAKTIGYYGYFELINGFAKAMYWSKEKMEMNAEKYSKGYAAHKGYTFWEKDFDDMAFKTMYRQLIGKYGVMSIDMQKAFANDMTVQPDITNTGDDVEPAEFFDVNETTGEVKVGAE